MPRTGTRGQTAYGVFGLICESCMDDRHMECTGSCVCVHHVTNFDRPTMNRILRKLKEHHDAIKEGKVQKNCRGEHQGDGSRRPSEKASNRGSDEQGRQVQAKAKVMVRNASAK